MLNRNLNVQECDAREVDSSNAGQYIKMTWNKRMIVMINFFKSNLLFVDRKLIPCLSRLLPNRRCKNDIVHKHPYIPK
jgi:hypothetical protein